jgi:hypothetical protein
MARLKNSLKKKTFSKAAYAGLEGREIRTQVRSLNDVAVFVGKIRAAKRRARKSELVFG